MQDGAPRCRVHERLPAVAACPSCGAPACLLCWHGAAARCTACLAREPGGDGAEVPWETTQPLVARFFRTLLGALMPQATAPGLGRPRGLARALVFALLTFVPPVAVFGAVELTRTLLFVPGLGVQVVGHAGRSAIALDVARSVLAALGVGMAGVLAVSLPYVSLCRAYGTSPHRTVAAVRVILYRAWVVPAVVTAFMLVAWAVPPSGGAVIELLSPLPFVVGVVELALSLRSGARDAAVMGPGTSWVVVVVPLALLMALVQLGGPALSRLVPPAPQAQRAATSNGSPR